MSSDNDLDEPSQEQMEKLAQFQEVTGVEDIGIARVELSQHEWDVEKTVQNYLMLRDSDRNSSLQDRNRLPAAVASPSGQRRREASRTQGVSPRRSSSLVTYIRWPLKVLYDWGFFLLSLPLRIFFASITSIYRFIIPDPLRLNPLGDVMTCIKEYESDYGTQHPLFFQGSYSQALNHAKMELKFLLVYLHSRDHQDTPKFCRETLSDASVIEYINSSMIFWSCSVTTGEGYRVSQALRENGYPFLAVIVLRDNRMTVVGRLEGPLSPSQLIERIEAIVRDNEAYLVVARADRQEREMTAALRQEQDVAYLESLRVDQEKARKRLEEQEELNRLEMAEKEKEQQIIEERERRRQLKIDYAERIPSEPEDGAEGIVHIVAKLPHGTRLERRFHSIQSLEALYYYIFCHPESPDRFQVTTNFPRKPVPCEPNPEGSPLPPTFEEFGLEKRSLLFVIDLDA